MEKVLFLDRDGVINDNERYRYVNKPEKLIIYEEAKEGLKKAYDAGYDLYLVTNQGGIELRAVTNEGMEEIHKKMVEELKPYCQFKDIIFCPDFFRRSGCRKPSPNMILELAEKHKVNLKDSWMIGDRRTDVEAGMRAGCKTAKIGEEDERATVNGANLLEVVEKILKYDGIDK